MIAKVVVDISLDREFDYLIPDELAATVRTGSRVSIPFGRRHTIGYVVATVTESPHKNLKPIHHLVGEKPYLDDTILKLARWMSQYYCTALEPCIRTVLPGAVRRKQAKFKQQKWVRLETEDGGQKSEAGGRKAEGGGRKAETCSARLHLASPTAERTGKTAAQQKILTLLAEHGGEMPLRALLKTANVSESPVKTLAKKNVLTIESRNAIRDPLKRYNVLPTQPLPLMPEQQKALDLIKGDLDTIATGHSPSPPAHRAPRPTLLYGVTGSGKTEVYLQAITYALDKGLGAIVLVPEISLTPQTIQRFQSRFGNRIAVLHSHLSDGERHDEWHRIRDGQARVIIGARSAVFAPVENLGLIVVDEEHEPSYKQAEAPRYHARDVAVMRGHLAGCAVVLGSATPAMESWINTQKGKYTLATLPRRADNRRMPAMRIIDMRVEAERTGHVNVFSQDLLKAIAMRLHEGEQTILFLNRRGYSSSLLCPKCGFVSECHQCSVSHTYHRSEEILRCHICGGSKPVPKTCPECADPAFRFAGLGTQRVEAVVKKCFPHARSARMDTDTTRRKAAYNEILGAFRDGKIDILVGTQMIAKGLHFPNVTLVGVVYADMSLHVPDFRAGERTYQLLAQVAGRAGRGDVAGEVIVQTYTPHHIAVQAARELDYEGLCAEELEFRNELHYPPATHLICITLKSKQEGEVKYCAEILAKRLCEAVRNAAIVSDACPAPLAKAKGYHRYQVMARGKAVRTITHPLKKILADLTPPKSVSISVDVDAIDLG